MNNLQIWRRGIAAELSAVRRERSGHTSRHHSKIARATELTKLLRRLPTLLILALSAFYPGVSWTHLEAQNIEGQIVASQFGEYQVPTVGNGFSFPPDTCEISGGSRSFPAFTSSVPIKIVDTNPAYTEVDTPVAVIANSSACAVSMTTTYSHSSFYLTSGTGGLQEAINNGIQNAGGANTVILNAEWYSLVAPSNPPTVIASVHGNTALGLVDVTTTPYTAYQWNGTAYAEVSYGGTLPSGSGLVKVTSGTGGVATPGADFLSPSITNGMLPQGTAITGTNYSSNQLQFIGSYCAGTSPCAPGYDEWNFQSYMGTGANPSSILNINHTGTSGPTAVDFNSQVFLSAGGTSTTQAPGDNSTKIATTANTFNNMPAVSAAYFGAYGDALAPADGCSITASSHNLTCPDAPFVSTDVGKQVWTIGGGAAGVAFNAAISSVTSSTVVVLSAAPSTSVTQAPGNTVYGHDDTTAVQACFQYSATNAVQCTLRALPPPAGQTGLTGFLIGSGGLQLVANSTDEESSASSFAGASPIDGTNLFCEYNGDCLSLAAGPIQGAIVSNISLSGNPSQPNGRGIHLNATASAYNIGGLWNSTFTNILVQNFALECMWMDGGGGPGYEYNLPNQIDTFNQFQCDGPNQSHPANLIKMTGQAAQILFQNGQVNGYGWSGGSSSMYPNPLIAIEEKTSGYSDTPSDVKFFGYTYEVGTQGLYVGEGGYNIHFDNGYVENVSSPLIVNGGTGGAQGLTFNGNHIANSGNITAIAQLEGNVTGGFRDNFEYGGAVTVTTLAACTGNNTVDFAGNVINGAAATTRNCVTSTASAPSSSTLTVTGGQTVSVGSSEIITTISAPNINPGKTLTLYASGNGIALATGGNINLGPYSSPMGVPPGGTITLTLFDQGTTWTVTGVNPAPVISCTAPTMTYRWTPASTCSTSQPCAIDQVAGNNASQSTSGDLPTYGATGGPNGLAALTFNGTSDYIIPTTPIASGLTSFTMYAIFKPAGTPSSGHNYDFFGGTNNSIEFGIDPSDNAVLNQQDIIGVNGNAAFPAGTWYTEIVTYQNGTTTTNFYKANGGALTPDGGSTSQALSFSATTPYLGGNTVTSSYFNGSIAEWGFLSGSANPSGIAQWSSCHYGI